VKDCSAKNNPKSIVKEKKEKKSVFKNLGGSNSDTPDQTQGRTIDFLRSSRIVKKGGGKNGHVSIGSRKMKETSDGALGGILYRYH